jgi:solute carrier family 20 (sodium-dependent phosphate transporter)
MEPYMDDLLWIVIVAFIVSFILAFAIGANDVANSFATSVGSGVLTLKQACYLASVFEISGAVLLGYKVSDTIRKGILDISMYEGAEKELMLGMLATLGGCAIWLLIATYAKLPVSTTHSIVGATVGFGLIARGTSGIQWNSLITIALSWVVSPILAGVISVAVYMMIYRFILKAKAPFKAGLAALPIIWGIVVFVNVISITLDGSKCKMIKIVKKMFFFIINYFLVLGMQNLKVWMSITISIAVGVITMILVQFFMVPWQKRKVLAEEPYKNTHQTISSIENGMKDSTIVVNSMTSSIDPIVQFDEKEEEKRVNLLFHFLQILAAIFSSFAHGGNDVANAIGPLITIWLIYTEGTVGNKAESPILILAYGGLGIVFGLWILGRRVIETVGFNLTKITPAT